MDKHQLIIIAVTAIIAATAKEVVTWAFSSIKVLRVSDTTKEKAKRFFNKNNRAVIYDLVWLSLVLSLLIGRLRETGPVTRWEVFKIVAYCIGLALWVLIFMWDLAMIRVSRWRDKQLPPTT
jgi:L-asparagine transporter-like permease